jgi:uncharacterized coiled-coil DUF342 family protein
MDLNSDTAAEQWFVDQLRRHLPGHLELTIAGVCVAASQLIAEAREQIDQREQQARRYLEEARELRVEVAKLAATVAALRGLPPAEADAKVLS